VFNRNYKRWRKQRIKEWATRSLVDNKRYMRTTSIICWIIDYSDDVIVWRHAVGNLVRPITVNFDSINIGFTSSLLLWVYFAMQINFQNRRIKYIYQHFPFGRSRLGCGVQHDTTKISRCAPWQNLLLRMYLRERVQVFFAWILRQCHSTQKRRGGRLWLWITWLFQKLTCFMCVLHSLQKWA